MNHMIHITRFIAFVGLIYQHSSALAVSENGYAATFAEKVQPFYLNKGRSGEFAGVDQVKIRYRVFIHPQAKASLVIACQQFVFLRHRRLLHARW